MHMCASLLKLADFVAGWRLSDRAREAEWRDGISIWNFNKDRKGKETAASMLAGEVCLSDNVCSVHWSMRAPPHLLISGISFGEC